MDNWWLKFNLKLLFTEILVRVPVINKLPLSLVKSYKQAYELIKGRASWLIDVTAPSIFVFENLDYLLQSPITIDEIMFENKYPPEMKLYLERLLDIMVSLGYVAKQQDTYVLTKPIVLEFTPEYQKFMEHELGATPSGREHVLLHDIYSSQKLSRSKKSSAIRRLGLIPNFYVFSNFILPFLKDVSIKSIGFAGGYVLSIIPLLNYFSSSKFTYFEHNPLVMSKLLKLVKSMSPNAGTHLNIVKKNIFVEKLHLERLHTEDLFFISLTYVLETEVSMNVLANNIANLLSNNGVVVFDDFILFSEESNPYLLASKEPPYFYHYLLLKPLTKALKDAGFNKIKFIFKCNKIGAYRGCIVKK